MLLTANTLYTLILAKQKDLCTRENAALARAPLSTGMAERGGGATLARGGGGAFGAPTKTLAVLDVMNKMKRFNSTLAGWINHRSYCKTKSPFSWVKLRFL